jgi:predicted protein tyrosine phosphatase
MAREQTKKRVLFVCTNNKVRSLTAEHVYRGRPDLEVRSAGVSEYASVPLTQELFDWADHVFVFSKRQRKFVEERFQNGSRRKTVVCLHLADRFEYKSPKLVIKLTGKLGQYLGQPVNNRPAATREVLAPPPAPSVADNPAAAPKTITRSPRPVVFNWFNSLLFGVMVLPFFAGPVLLSPVATP